MSLISCTLSIAHVEPALTEERTLLPQEPAAGQAAELCHLGGREGHRVIVKDELVTRNVSGGHNHPPHPRPCLDKPGIAGGAILMIIAYLSSYKLTLTFALWIFSCFSQKLIDSHN